MSYLSAMPDGQAPDAARSRFDHAIERLALLEDPVRRALYRYLVRHGDYVGRDEAAAALGIARSLAAFHLDKLADEHLVEFVYRRPKGRTGRGAGRPAKLYRRSRKQLSISLPQRDYELLAELLASSLEPDMPADVARRLTVAARDAGAALASEARSLAGRRPSRRRLLQVGLEILWQQGFEPHGRDDDRVVLRNCPFQAVASTHRDLVCPINKSLMEGFVAGLKVTRVRVAAEPNEDSCCVTLYLHS